MIRNSKSKNAKRYTSFRTKKKRKKPDRFGCCRIIQEALLRKEKTAFGQTRKTRLTIQESLVLKKLSLTDKKTEHQKQHAIASTMMVSRKKISKNQSDQWTELTAGQSLSTAGLSAEERTASEEEGGRVGSKKGSKNLGFEEKRGNRLELQFRERVRDVPGTETGSRRNRGEYIIVCSGRKDSFIRGESCRSSQH